MVVSSTLNSFACSSQIRRSFPIPIPVITSADKMRPSFTWTSTVQLPYKSHWQAGSETNFWWESRWRRWSFMFTLSCKFYHLNPPQQTNDSWRRQSYLPHDQCCCCAPNDSSNFCRYLNADLANLLHVNLMTQGDFSHMRKLLPIGSAHFTSKEWWPRRVLIRHFIAAWALAALPLTHFTIAVLHCKNLYETQSVSQSD